MTTEDRLKLLETQVRGLLNRGKEIDKEVDRVLYEIKGALDDVEGALDELDHGSLLGLTDDDHTQYLLINGTRAMTGNLRMNGNYVSNDGGNEGLYVNSDGDVGICLSSPTARLDIVSSSARIIQTGLSGQSGHQRWVQYGTGNHAQWRVNIQEDNTTRDVAADESYALTLDGDNGNGMCLFRWPATTGTFKQMFGLNATAFLVNDASATTALYVAFDSQNNVGIGNSSPAARLDVRGYDQTSGYYCARFADSAGYTILQLRNDNAIGFYMATPVPRATTSGAESTHAQLSGNVVSDASTFDGYTLGQVVKALRNIGILT